MPNVGVTQRGRAVQNGQILNTFPVELIVDPWTGVNAAGETVPIEPSGGVKWSANPEGLGELRVDGSVPNHRAVFNPFQGAEGDIAFFATAMQPAIDNNFEATPANCTLVSPPPVETPISAGAVEVNQALDRSRRR